MSAPRCYLMIAICLLYQLPADAAPEEGTALCKKPDGTALEMNPEKDFYRKGELVTVKCQSGYRPSKAYVKCVNPGTANEWNYPPQCIALCKKPDETTFKVTPEKEFYNAGDSVTVICQVGYQASPSTMTCVKRGTANEWNKNPQCIAMCKKPTGATLNPEKDFYRNGDSVTVTCQDGNQPSPSTITCVSRGTANEWNYPPQCVAQCAHPEIGNMKKNAFGYKESYDKDEWITVYCEAGYYPSSSRMRCDNPGTPPEWTPPTVTCTGVTMTISGVTSTSISVQMSCSPQCPHEWRFTVTCCAEPYKSCQTSSGISATFTRLKPNSLYRISTSRGITPLESRVIRTQESAPGRPEIMKIPSMEDETMTWKLGDSWGAITGFQMNISSWRGYNVSFAAEESFLFPSDVTEYRISLQYGTNYTIALRGFTSAGAGEVTTLNIETEVGDPPHHMENTLSNDTLQLHPVPNLNGPIRSYEIIVFDVQEDNSTMDCLRYKSAPYSSSVARGPYTAAVLPSETLTAPGTFTLGDNHHYHGFHNAPLTPDHNYTVYIRVTSHLKRVEKSSCAFAGFLRAPAASPGQATTGTLRHVGRALAGLVDLALQAIEVLKNLLGRL